ncbi:MAG: RES domain-containing protein [Proteobacteria bacterium]|nr:MAG: RES domain-containing protein [Pseudomonadota bacterium]
MTEAGAHTLPPPPSFEILESLAPELERIVLEAGQTIYRIHATHFAPTQFNPGAASARFSPLYTNTPIPVIVPVLYAGDTPIGAACETVFRALDGGIANPRIPRGRVEGRCISRITPNRPLSLLKLSGSTLRQLGIVRAPLLEASPTAYRETSAWAQRFYLAMPDIDGLIWISRQHDDSRAMVFFGDRCGPNDFTSSESQCTDTEDGFLAMQALAYSVGVTIIEP